MSIFSILITLISIAFVLLASGVAIAFFGEWAWSILRDLQHHNIV